MDSDTQPIFSKQPILKIIEKMLGEENPGFVEHAPDAIKTASSIWLDHHIEHTGVEELNTWDFTEETIPGLWLYDSQNKEIKDAHVNEDAPEYLRPCYEFSYKNVKGEEKTGWVVVD